MSDLARKGPFSIKVHLSTKTLFPEWPNVYGSVVDVLCLELDSGGNFKGQNLASSEFGSRLGGVRYFKRSPSEDSQITESAFRNLRLIS
jgi:hypothetical protein